MLWLIISVGYIWSTADIGRSLGANTNSAFEHYIENYTKEYAGAEGAAEALTDSWSYSYFNDLSKEFRSGYLGLGVTTVIYIAVTIGCYHYTFSVRKKT